MNPEELLTYPAEMRLVTLKIASGVPATDVGINRPFRIVNKQCLLGTGEHVFQRVQAAIENFTIQREAGIIVSFRDRILRQAIGPSFSSSLILKSWSDIGFDSTSHVNDTTVKVRRAGMVLGTLPDHIQRGEEAYLVEMDETGAVIGRCISITTHRLLVARFCPVVPRWCHQRTYTKYLTAMQKVAGTLGR